MLETLAGVVASITKQIEALIPPPSPTGANNFCSGASEAMIPSAALSIEGITIRIMDPNGGDVAFAGLQASQQAPLMNA